MNVDTTSRMINNIWNQYQTYIQFTNLNDDANSTKCLADTHGPKAARYCADGGVYYLQSMAVTEGIPMTAKPYAYDSLQDVNLPVQIQPWWIPAASSKVYQQYHMMDDFSDVNSFTDSISALVADGVNPVASLMGQLPGEWTLRVCDGGYNYFGWDYVTGNWGGDNNETDPWKNSVGDTYQVPHQWVPCACGFQGNETALFYNQSNILALGEAAINLIRQSCQTTMSANNNQGFLQINSGMPSNNEITLGVGQTLTMTPTSAPPVRSDPPRFV
ncbi:hypothetical protein P7C71_g5484, partial [Lecanoromycetidae sp. Uapishka_2]